MDENWAVILLRLLPIGLALRGPSYRRQLAVFPNALMIFRNVFAKSRASITIHFRPFHGLIIPSLFIRNLSVERFIPNLTAAPFGPADDSLVFFNVSRMRSRSVSAIVLNSNFIELAAIRFGGISPTSSRRSVPLCASSKRPIRWAMDR